MWKLLAEDLTQFTCCTMVFIFFKHGYVGEGLGVKSNYVIYQTLQTHACMWQRQRRKQGGRQKAGKRRREECEKWPTRRLSRLQDKQVTSVRPKYWTCFLSLPSPSSSAPGEGTKTSEVLKPEDERRNAGDLELKQPRGARKRGRVTVPLKRAADSSKNLVTSLWEQITERGGWTEAQQGEPRPKTPRRKALKLTASETRNLEDQLMGKRGEIRFVFRRANMTNTPLIEAFECGDNSKGIVYQWAWLYLIRQKFTKCASILKIAILCLNGLFKTKKTKKTNPLHYVTQPKFPYRSNHNFKKNCINFYPFCGGRAHTETNVDGDNVNTRLWAPRWFNI